VNGPKLGLQRARRAGTVLGRPRVDVNIDKLKNLQQSGLTTFILGPRFSFHRYERIVQFVHVLLGVSHISGEGRPRGDFFAIVVSVAFPGSTPARLFEIGYGACGCSRRSYRPCA
jgi:hypothetical protein